MLRGANHCCSYVACDTRLEPLSLLTQSALRVLSLLLGELLQLLDARVGRFLAVKTSVCDQLELLAQLFELSLVSQLSLPRGCLRAQCGRFLTCAGSLSCSERFCKLCIFRCKEVIASFLRRKHGLFQLCRFSGCCRLLRPQAAARPLVGIPLGRRRNPLCVQCGLELPPLEHILVTLVLRLVQALLQTRHLRAQLLDAALRLLLQGFDLRLVLTPDIDHLLALGTLQLGYFGLQ